jgi:hypothetical protein
MQNRDLCPIQRCRSLYSVLCHNDLIEALDMKAKFQGLQTRPPQPHGNLADLAANAVFDVILPHRIRLARKFQRQANSQGIRGKTGGTLLVVFGEKDVFVDRRTTLFVTLARTKCLSSFLTELPRFENSRNVEMTTSQVNLLEECTMVSKALRSLLVSRLCLSQ